MKNKILVVAAHPDDEVLGVGGTIMKYIELGYEIYVIILTDGGASRYTKARIRSLYNDSKRCNDFMGVKKVSILDLPDQKLDKVALIDIAQRVEKVISELKPDVVYTHNSNDVNQDHRAVFKATMIATRPIPDCSVKRVISYEVPSSTEWGSFNSRSVFTPNLYEDITNYLNKKIEAFKCYISELKKFPHPRSLEGIRILAQYRGITVGVNAAEAFRLVRELR